MDERAHVIDEMNKRIVILGDKLAEAIDDNAKLEAKLDDMRSKLCPVCDCKVFHSERCQCGDRTTKGE